MSQGQNVKQLIVRRMSTQAIPSGAGMKEGIDFLSSPEKVSAGAREATDWVKLANQAVRDAGEPNPWTKASDELIAGEILRQIEDGRKKPA